MSRSNERVITRLCLAAKERFGLCVQAEKITAFFTFGCRSRLSILVVDLSFVIESVNFCLRIKFWIDYFNPVLSKYFAQTDDYSVETL